MAEASLLFSRPVPGARRTPGRYLLSWPGTAVMGILNVTPDSFSDGGEHYGLEASFERALAMRAAGALVLDIGGESTRPGAEPVAAEVELGRILPLIERLADREVLISVDTYKPEVAAAALAAGAHLINDVTGLRNPEMVAVCAEAEAPAVIMHMQGEPRTMQLEPRYEDAVAEVAAYLRAGAERALAAGLPSVMLDPGFGFGKTLAHNLSLVRGLPTLAELGHPVVLGASRKRSIDTLSAAPLPADRDPGSLALHLYAAGRGAAMVRVHNVAAHVQALRVWQALEDGQEGEEGG